MDVASTSPVLDVVTLPVLPGWVALMVCLFFIWLGIKDNDMFFLVGGIVMLAFVL